MSTGGEEEDPRRAQRPGERVRIRWSAASETGAPENDRSDPRLRWGKVFVVVGLLLIVWGVLHVTSAAYGTDLLQLEERRSYDQVKRTVHASYFGGLLRGLVGLGLVWAGLRMRARARDVRPLAAESGDGDDSSKSAE